MFPKDDENAHDVFRRAALAYAARGWWVLPLHSGTAARCSCSAGPACRSPGKHPRTARGSKDATTDQHQIERWCTASAGANVGIATGRASGLLVLDIDPRNGGTATLERLEWELGALPHTVEVFTGGRGLHLYFVAPAIARARGSLGRGIDVKFEGGYVVAPPSRHASGRLYEWANGRSPCDAPLAALPDAWVRALSPRLERVVESVASLGERAASGRERRARAYIRTVPPAISGQHGHDATFRAAVLLVRGFDLDGETAFRVLREEWNPSCDPPWSDNDLRRKVDQAIQHSTASRGFLLAEQRGDRWSR